MNSLLKRSQQGGCRIVCAFRQRSILGSLSFFSTVDSSNGSGSDKNNTNCTPNVQTSRDYCVETVYKNDYQAYIGGLLFPAKHRNAYFAIRAFNVEIATIKDQIPKTAMQSGRMRFNFWRDILKNMEEKGELPKHVNQPVALELLEHVQNYGLSVRLLERCLEARYTDVVNNGVFETMDDLENYAEYGHSSILYLLLEILDINNEQIQNAASHLGVSAGITTLLRGYAHHAQQGYCYIPRAVRMKHGVADNCAVSGPTNEGEKKKLQEATHDVASQAHAHLDSAKKIFNNHPLSEKAIYAMLCAVPTDMYLQDLLKHDSDPFLTCAAIGQQTPLRFQWNTLKAKFLNQI